jgi:hypothetical protein
MTHFVGPLCFFFPDQISYLKKVIFKAGIKSEYMTSKHWFSALAAHWKQ